MALLLLLQEVLAMLLLVEIDDGGVARHVVLDGALAGHVALLLREVDGKSFQKG